VPKHSLEIIETHATGAPALVYLGRDHRPPVLTRVSTTQSQMNAASSVHSRIKHCQIGIERFAVRSSDALVTHARSHRDVICALEGYQPGRFALVPHGLPAVAVQAMPDALPLLETGAIEVLFVGRFEHRKGIDVLLAAIPLVIASCPHAHFTLAGSKGDEVHWNEFARGHPDLVGNRVTALGRIPGEHLEALYARCAMLVAPSRYESFGLVYVEAMRHAKPVIGCNTGGVPDVVDHGRTGLLAPPGDTSALAATLIQLIRDPALGARLGAAGRAAFLSRFSAAGMAKASAALYKEIAASEDDHVV